MPRVLFSSPECRVVVVDVANGEEIGDHHVRERAVVEVVTGRVSIESSGQTAECDAGALVTFDPGAGMREATGATQVSGMTKRRRSTPAHEGQA